MNDIFTFIADYYDDFSSGRYDDYAEMLVKAFEQYSDIKVNEILDLACGTGCLATLLADKGYDMVAVDISADMLSVAQSKNIGNRILYINSDMRQFELYGTVQATVCAYDSLNYLNSYSDLNKVFRLVRNYTEKGGLFVFDLNTLYRYENVFAQNAFVYEKNNDMLVWQNYYNEKTRRCDFYLTLFSQTSNGYARYDETQRQKYFTDEKVIDLLKSNKFEPVAVLGDFEFGAPTDGSEKKIFIMKAI